jgi:hypothetical protein
VAGFFCMKNRRVRLGTFPDNKVRLRVSSPGFDAVEAIDDGHAITFDSDFTDIAKITTVGIANEVVINVVSGVNVFGIRATYPNLGFKPFVEVRSLVGSVVFDDFFNSTFPSGSYTLVESSQLTVNASGSQSNAGLQALFIVYRIPVPSG